MLVSIITSRHLRTRLYMSDREAKSQTADPPKATVWPWVTRFCTSSPASTKDKKQLNAPRQMRLPIMHQRYKSWMDIIHIISHQNEEITNPFLPTISGPPRSPRTELLYPSTFSIPCLYQSTWRTNRWSKEPHGWFRLCCQGVLHDVLPTLYKIDAHVGRILI